MNVLTKNIKALNQLLFIFTFYLCILLFNIGGFFTSFYAVNLFYIIVPISILIAFLVGRYSFFIPNSDFTKVFWGFIFVYLTVSIISFHIYSYDEKYPLVYNLRTFGYSIINVYIFYRLSLIFHMHRKFDLLLTLFGRICLLAMLLTAFFPYFNIVPLDFTKASDSLMTIAHSYNIRLTGFYLNPNLAGYVANVSLVFAMTLLIFDKRFNLVAIVLFFLSIYISIRSFSKTAILVSLILSIVFFTFLFLKKQFWFSTVFKQRRFVVFTTLAIGFILVYKSATWYQSLDEGQKQRIDQVLSIVSEVEINEKTTTHRSEIWEIGVKKIERSPVIGYGFGSFDHFEDVGQGIHNMYLKIFGEAGFFIGLYYLLIHVLLIIPLYYEKNSHIQFLILGLMISTFIFNFSNHNAFITPIISMVYGVLLSFSNQFHNE